MLILHIPPRYKFDPQLLWAELIEKSGLPPIVMLEKTAVPGPGL
jgi:hypothetical protein